MRALRHHTTLGTIALLAFALQVVLACAHMHAHDDVAAGARDMAARAVTYGMCRAADGRTCPAPAQHDDSGCPTCWAAGLASFAVLGSPPVAALPTVGFGETLPERETGQLCASSSVHFNARAPPHLVLV